MNDPVLDFLHRRASVPSRQLADPGPTPEQLQRILQGALRVPDHGRLTPWRFVLIEREQGQALGQRLAERLRELDSAATAAAIDKELERFTRAPLTVVLVCSPTLGHKVPECEQLLSAGCVGMMLLLLAQAEGFGAQWLTGWPAYDAQVQQWLGLAEPEQVVGFFYLGTPGSDTPERPRPTLAERISRWSPT
jgi:nitroreductase